MIRIGIVALALVLGPLGLHTGPAQPPSPPAQTADPSALALEIAAGTLGGIAVGIGGAWAGGTACAEATEAGLACLGAALLGYLAGLPVGAATGVHGLAQWTGTEGSFGIGLLGGAGAEALTLTIAWQLGKRGLAPDDLPALVYVGVLPITTAVGTTWAYRVGDWPSLGTTR